MSIKTIGAEWKAFYADDLAWPDGCYHEDDDFKVNGKSVGDTDLSLVPDDCQIVIVGGVVFDQEGNEIDSLEGHFRKWRKRLDTVTFVVECKRDVAGAVKEAVRKAGGRAF